jgi:autoinducer 2 (AI-2) kinase
MIIDKRGKALGVSRKSWDYTTLTDLEIAKEFDPAEFWKLVCQVVRGALEESKLGESNIESIATTGQRHGIVLLDAEGRELHGSPNIDARGAMTQYLIDESLGEKYHEITGCWPPLMFSPARIAWFEEEEPAIFQSIAHLLPISDWITYRLSGKFVTDLSSAGSTGFLDIRTGKWSEEVASAIGVDLSILPEILRSGDVVGQVTEKASKDCGLETGLPVIQGGADTHCALLASDSSIGEVTVIAGSTAPVMMIVDDYQCATDRKVWTGTHLIEGKWVIESNATMTGANLEWIVDLLCERAEDPEKCSQRTFQALDEIVKDVPPGSNETYAAVGPRVMDSQKMTDIKQARLVFPQPALPQIDPLNSPGLINSVLENIAYAIKGNIKQLETYKDSTKIKTIGGMSRSDSWPQLLANVLNRPVSTPSQSEGSLLGAAICAAAGVGFYSSIETACKAMVKWRKTYEPDERAILYEGYYSRWLEIWHEGE